MTSSGYAAHSGSRRLVLAGRAEKHLHGRNDLADTIARLQAHQEAGAELRGDGTYGFLAGSSVGRDAVVRGFAR
jgi:hypothetical protein